MFQLDYRDRRPLYEQIKEKMKTLIVNEVLKIDEKLPSVRELAQSLTINPNTIQKAYKDLEDEGYIYSVRGKGNFVAPRKNVIDQNKLNELTHELEKILSEIMYLGVEKDVILSLVNNMYKQRKAGSKDD